MLNHGAALRISGLLLAALLSGAVAHAAGGDPPPLEFGRDVRPILAEHCWGCHSGDEPAGELRLNERAAALDVVAPGKPDESELLRRIESEDEHERMPPAEEDPLSAAEIATLRRWVQQGAPWSGHWAFEPLRLSNPPPVRHPQWVREGLDHFVLAQLEQSQIDPAPEADRFTLIKRLYYDLVGLPPSVAEVDAFASDTAPDAYERLVDRLLSSPHFGERWGRHWLDLAHYADSDGYETDRARPDAYLYRDWVIAAVNADMPFDQFTVEQLAGDLLPGATARQHIATSFLRQTLTNEEGGVDQEEYRVAAVFDRTETIGTVWLAMTINCVRCHTHKYDPLQHDEYYRLYAFFNNADEVARELPIAARDLQALEAALEPLEARRAARYRELARAEQAWATEHHQRILATPDTPLRSAPFAVTSVTAPNHEAFAYQLEKDAVLMQPQEPALEMGGAREVSPPHPETATYVVRGKAVTEEVTGFKLWALPHADLPAAGPGRAANGNFVLTGFRAAMLLPGGERQPLELHRVESDFSQDNYPAAAVLNDDPQRGWAVAPKMGAAHWLQLRTVGPVNVPADAEFEIVLEQNHGGGHTLGHFRLELLHGDARGLHLTEKPIADILEMYPEKRTYAKREQLFGHFVRQVARDAEVAALEQQIRQLQQASEARMMTVRTVAAARLERPTHVMHRGDFLQPAAAVAPGIPAIFSAHAPLHTSGESATRLDFARWLVSNDNFLTPRVMVNRIWQRLFGAGLVRTPNDFGTRGELPTHPELLDWLAHQFQHELRWSRKELIRRIVVSATYRQASQHRADLEQRDPLNTLLFRQNRFRVEGEVVRDLHLGVSGLLTARIGGPSVFPPMPEDLAKLSYANNFTWTNSTGADRYRRGLYTFFKRTVPHPNLMTFDAPDANVACVQRTISNTPLQALLLLNNEVHVEAAQAFAARALAETGSDQQRLTQALRACVARPPRGRELETLQKVLAASRAYYAGRSEDARLIAGPGLESSQDPAEAAAWVATLRVLLNLDEFVTRE